MPIDSIASEVWKDREMRKFLLCGLVFLLVGIALLRYFQVSYDVLDAQMDECNTMYGAIRQYRDPDYKALCDEAFDRRMDLFILPIGSMLTILIGSMTVIMPFVKKYRDRKVALPKVYFYDFIPLYAIWIGMSVVIFHAWWNAVTGFGMTVVLAVMDFLIGALFVWGFWLLATQRVALKRQRGLETSFGSAAKEIAVPFGFLVSMFIFMGVGSYLLDWPEVMGVYVFVFVMAGIFSAWGKYSGHNEREKALFAMPAKAKGKKKKKKSTRDEGG